MSRLRRTWAGRVLLPLLAVPATLLLGLWVVAHTWLPAHIENVIGRAGQTLHSCNYCHRTVGPPPTYAEQGPSPYVSPRGLAVSPDGGRLYVAASDSHQLLVVDLETRSVVGSAPLSGRPHDVAVSPDGQRLAVSVRDDDRVVILDADSLEERGELGAMGEPLGLTYSPSGDKLCVANGATDDVLLTTARADARPLRLVAGNEPYDLAVSRDGALLAVANRLARPVPPGEVPRSEVTLIQMSPPRILARHELISGHLSEGVAVSSDGSFVLAPMVRIRNLLPLTQVARGAAMNSAIAFIETRPGGSAIQLPLGEVNAFFADPSGIVLTADDRIAFVAHGGARTVTVVDVAALRELVSSESPAALAALADDLSVSSRYVLARIPTRDNPRNLALSPDGKRLFVSERLADSIAVIDTARLEVVDHIDLGGPATITKERRGERVFYSAAGTFQGQFSCRSCHPGGHTDGLIWDFEIDGIGKNIVETRSLRGIRYTAPFKWNGKNRNLQTQCGPRFARVLTRSEPFSADQLDALVAFIESLPLPPRRGAEGVEAAVARGRELFHRTHTGSGREIPRGDRCDTCHRPPLFTDRLKSEVGTDGAFDTPHLLAVGSSPPYLHDGRALTLEEIWTVYSPNNDHGVTSDLTKAQLNDLVLFLRSL